MSLTQPIMNLEKTDSIPQGSTFVVEMGDGSGTKAITKENLEKSTGEALKIGNLEELQTEAKDSVVAAINEAAQSGGSGSAVDILDTKEEIEANTETGKAAGAQAVKAMFGELNDNLQNKNKTKVGYTSTTHSDRHLIVEGLGFRPQTILCFFTVNNAPNIMLFDERMEYGYICSGTNTYGYSVFDYTFNNDGFCINVNNNDCPVLWFALGA